MITRNLNTPESREFWAAAERAARRVETWPAWKLGQIEPRRAESMATKKEVWLDNSGDLAPTEFGALVADFTEALENLEPTNGDAYRHYSIEDISHEIRVSIDALHEYAHRGDAKVETGIKLRVGGVYITRDGRNTVEIFRQLDAEDDEGPIEEGYAFKGRVIAGSDSQGTTYYYSTSGGFNTSSSNPHPDDLTHAVVQADTATVLPEGVPPELDDWVKRWEWITAKVSVDAIRKLRDGDEFRVGTRWCPVYDEARAHDGERVFCVRFIDDARSELNCAELAAIANEVRYNGR